MKFPSKANATFFLLLSAFCIVIGWGWLTQTPSFEELPGDITRAAEYFWAAWSVGNWPWWTPNYLMGHSHAIFATNLLPLFALMGVATLLSSWLTTLTSFKLTGIAIIFLGGWAMRAFAQRLFVNEWTAVLCGLLYATSAQFVLRVAMLEHLTTAACMIFSPLILLGLIRCETNSGWRNALLLAMAVSGMVLCYVKLFLLFLPAAAVFLIWRWLSCSPENRKNLLVGCLKGAALSIPLGLFPLLPLAREAQWVAAFELAPFAGWQQTYSFFSAISWADFGNYLTAGSSLGALNTSRHAAIEFYLGGVILVGILAALYFRPQIKAFPNAGGWNQFRFFCSLMLLATWFASGPRSLIFSHIEFLYGANQIAAPSIALAWLALVLQAVIIWRLWDGSYFQLAGAAICMAIYFFIPGFRLLEIIPLYRDIRAPSAVWPAFGTLAAVLAASAAWQILAKLHSNNWQKILGLSFLVLLFAADSTFLHRAFFRPGLPAELFSDYEAAQKILAKAPVSGSVFCVSGRYFYLTTPELSGRAVASEALLRHFQLRWIRHMESYSNSSANQMKTYFDLFGIAYILIDRHDPDLSPEMLKFYETLFPKIYENFSFTILQNKGSLAPAYFAEHLVQVPAESFRHGNTLLNLGQFGLIGVESEESPFDATIDSKGQFKTSTEERQATRFKLHPLKLSAPRTLNYHQFQITGIPDHRGLVLATEAYHPDWQAEQNGKALSVHRAMGALLSVHPDGNGPVTFTFTPPWWYNACLWATLIAWLMALLYLGLTRFKTSSARLTI